VRRVWFRAVDMPEGLTPKPDSLFGGFAFGHLALPCRRHCPDPLGATSTAKGEPVPRSDDLVCVSKPSKARRPRRAFAAGVALAVGCGVAAATAAAALTTQEHAASPTSGGAVNPKAIPLGDGHVTSTPKVGYVDSCMSQFNGRGAQVVGPWIDQTARTWNGTAKIAVNGAVAWPGASYSLNVVGSKRVIAFNDLPTGHTTGVFPIAGSDPAYAYDRNPNRIAPQSTRWSLPLDPKAAKLPSCTGGGPIGVLRDGVYLYNALDALGRDAAAHEVLDACAGHPDMSGGYHHHNVPLCILATSPNGASTLAGYALDGYGIYVVKDAAGNLPTNASLDACHGTTSAVTWNGKTTRIYHYVATLEYPYTVGCFHGTPIDSRRGPGPGGP